MFKRPHRIVLAVIGLLILATAIYNLPFVHSRLAWRVEAFQAKIRQFFRPPAEQVFIPAAPTAGPTTLPTPIVTRVEPPVTATPTLPLPTDTPTISPTPLPQRVDLKGDRFYTDQKNRWNYCGPANLVMALKFWGWKGLPGRTDDLRDQVASVVKPGFADPSKNFIERGRLDLNVMPYEMADFVTNYTDYAALIRHGGELNTLKALVSAGFPPVIEKGYYERDTQGKRTWMGHYLFVTGYDDAENVFIVQDAYYLNEEKPRKNRRISYEELLEGWRSFNYLFMVVYPPEREQELMTILGNWSDPQWAYRHALELAETDIQTQTEIDLFFSWFNKGTSLVQLQDYAGAAAAYDQAFTLYAGLTQDNSQRPYRMVWYQTGPYWAYFYTGRYQDVINLANVTLATPSVGPTLEESLYWRAMAYYALGQTGPAAKDMLEAVRLNPNFAPGIQRLKEWGLR
ncbi:MAG: tetratricopeptide repeat protein [Anaerolineales bacterium]|nr:tetratricopeptide repeat protein [Anaerolineales bacterium]